jgi:tetratricopeptide (TPR) repeat protein
MKKLSVLFLMFALSFSLTAQKSAVTSAWSYLKDGFLDDAKKSIDKAELHADTKDWYKTHYFKGMIYQELGVSDKPKYKSLCTDCLDVAYEAYVKAIRLNFVNPDYRNLDLTTEVGLMQFVKVLSEGDDRNYENTEALYDIIGNRFPALSNAFINQGVSKYQANDYEGAYTNFEKAVMISTLSFKADTQLYYFASLAAMKAKKFEEAITLNDFLIQLNFGADDDEKVGVYLNQAVAYRETGDTVKMLTTLEKGIEKFPAANYPLVIETFNYYVNKGESEKAFEYINIAIESNKEDAQFYVIRGTLLEEMKRKQEAEADYLKAIELQPDNFDANYSLGAFYYNTAVDTLDWADKNIPINKFADLDKYKAIANDYFKKSSPYLEKSHATQPDNMNVLGTLKTIYYRLGEMEKYNETTEKINALTQ